MNGYVIGCEGTYSWNKGKHSGYHRYWIGAAIDYIKSLIHTLLEAHDRFCLEQAVFVRTIAIPTLGIQITEFDLSP